MMMDSGGITPVYNVDGNNNSGFGGDGGWVWIIFLFFLMAWGGNGWGNGFGGGSGGAGFQGYATRADVNEGFLFNNVQNGITDISSQMCNGFANTNLAITNLGYNMQNCCCETQRAIDGVNYNMAKNTCDIIQANNANTQRIIDTITTDKIDSLRTELQSAQLQISQLSQTSNIVNQLRPTPIPAYITCSPYEAAGLYNHCGCGC